jgi:hypothetical protein
MRKLILVVACALLSACGNSDSPLNGAPLNTAFTGTWTGTTDAYEVISAAVNGCAPNECGWDDRDTGQIVIAVSGNSMTVSEICPGDIPPGVPPPRNASGMITMTGTGSGNSATWSGNYACPAYVLQGCEQVITYTSATATLNGSSLKVLASGTAAGCLPGNITVTFTSP